MSEGKIVQIICGGENTFVLLDDGTVKCWKNNDHDLIEIINISYLDEKIKITQISCGRSHLSVLLDDGSIRSWGPNKFVCAPPDGINYLDKKKE